MSLTSTFKNTLKTFKDVLGAALDTCMSIPTKKDFDRAMKAYQDEAIERQLAQSKKDWKHLKENKRDISDSDMKTIGEIAKNGYHSTLDR